jgi:hypothetical protein
LSLIGETGNADRDEPDNVALLINHCAKGDHNMSARRPPAREFVQFHKDGTVWARGQTVADQPSGYWEWFRKDGTKLRSGHFDDGEQVDEWTTYDRRGKVYKVTRKKPKAS